MPLHRRPRLGHVAWRVTLTFIACALVPLVALAVVTERRTTAQLDRQAVQRLQYDAKELTVNGLGQLDLWSNTLRVMATTLAAGSADVSWYASRIDELLPHGPSAVVYVPEDGVPRAIVGDAQPPRLSERDRTRLQTAGLLLRRVSSEDWLFVRSETGGSSMVAMTLDYGQLFGVDRSDLLPPASDVCVLAEGFAARCSSTVPSDVAARIGDIRSDVDLRVQGPEGPLLVRMRTVPLGFNYDADPWTLAMIRPYASVVEPLAQFRRDFWLIIALTVLVVSVLSLSLVRRQLGPLKTLTGATRRLAHREFTQPVDIQSGDEFEELGHAFNTLSAELKRQFDELEDFNIGTLETLARAIDAKSPWTAGHSERVTRLAVHLARELELPEEEVDLLQRGGLVHDIGKLATPVAILDKPGALTDEEYRIMQQHVLQGVHILRPIKAFHRYLPIVEQHHERWDGKGYPHGLTGAQMTRPARVAAVADACDAMHSDRPYRQGLPIEEVIRRVQAGAGSHFDPEVAAAFVRFAERGGEISQGRVARPAA